VENKKSKRLFGALSSHSQPATKNEIFFLAWTTTPWTLPSNLGLTIGPSIDYVLVKTLNPYTLLPINVILAKELFKSYFTIIFKDKEAAVSAGSRLSTSDINN